MLNKKKTVFVWLLCCSLLIGVPSIFENSVHADEPSKNKDVSIFGDKYNVNPIKPWVINTSVPIDTSCLKDAITVTDSNGLKVDVSFSTTNNDKSIIVMPPKDGYRNGQSYTVTVSKNLKSRDKKYSLKQPAQMNFKTNKKCINEINITKDSPLTKANNSFSFNLIKNLEEKNSEKNIVISPFSISSLLALTQNGALDQTKKELLNTIGFKEVYPIDLNGDYKNIFDYYTNLPTDPIQISNSIWLKKDFQIEKEFMDISQEYYYSQIESLDFNNSNSVKTINDWASKSTNGQIKEIIKEINPNTLSIFSNAIHFKGSWINEFYPKSTQPREFTLSNGTKLNVPMMEDRRHAPYYKGNNFSAITLSYYDNLEMNLFLPNKNVSIDSFMKNMNKENFDKWMDKLESREVICKIPKFKLNCDEDLEEPLKNLGMKAIFNPENCNLSKISNYMYVDTITHKTAINVDEKGTEASAVTTQTDGATACAPDDNPPEFIVDRPFLFTIRDNKTGIILFMGKVENPLK